MGRVLQWQDQHYLREIQIQQSTAKSRQENRRVRNRSLRFGKFLQLWRIE